MEADVKDWIENKERKKMTPSIVGFQEHRMNTRRVLHKQIVTLPPLGRAVDKNDDVQIPKKD